MPLDYHRQQQQQHKHSSLSADKKRRYSGPRVKENRPLSAEFAPQSSKS